MQKERKKSSIPERLSLCLVYNHNNLKGVQFVWCN